MGDERDPIFRELDYLIERDPEVQAFREAKKKAALRKIRDAVQGRGCQQMTARERRQVYLLEERKFSQYDAEFGEPGPWRKARNSSGDESGRQSEVRA
jgi:hypothetical protein